MDHIGEFSKKTKVFLELLTLGQDSKHIAVDFPPTVSIERFDQYGLEAIESVKLEALDNHFSYSGEYTIPEILESGEYVLTYIATIKGKEYKRKEQFTVISECAPSFENNRDVVVLDGDNYMFSSEFQIPTSISVEGKKVEIIFEEKVKYNYTYQVVLGDEIKSKSGLTLGGIKTLTFTSKYEPIFATPLEVKNIIGSLFKYFSLNEVYCALRDAGQKALQYIGEIPDANNSRYSPPTEQDDTYFAITKYVVREAVRLLLQGLMFRVLNNSYKQEDEGGLSGTIQLGDFMIQDNLNSANESSDSPNGIQEESLFKKLQIMIASNQKEIKFWLDVMMEQNKQNHNESVSGSFGAATSLLEG
ncbi:hypothetical protein P4J09_12155 [Bacillus cereus]|nr:hypothetical protein [Bacillus cereus]